MRKRVLLAEPSDTIRGIGESVLRQNGYEVVSVSTGTKALEVLEFARPDLIICAAELEGKGRRFLYEQFRENPRSASIPLLVLDDRDGTDLPLPPEVIIRRPFSPEEFIGRVAHFCSTGAPRRQQSSSNPLAGAELNDAFLDAALGMSDSDSISVTDSEVMNRSGRQPGANRRSHVDDELLVGSDNREEELHADSGRVESIMIRDDQRKKPENKPGKPSASESGKIDILEDQFGLIHREAHQLEPEDSTHDYSWFINEMQRDTTSPGSSSSTGDEDKLTFHDPSSMVDPVTKGPAASDASAKTGPVSAKQRQSPGVDKFIDEFKQEIERFRATDETVPSHPAGSGREARKGDDLDWRDSLERMTPEGIAAFRTEFVRELADRLAARIAEKIDPVKLHNLIAREIINEQRRTGSGKK